MIPKPNRILVLSRAVVGRRMSSPGIRSYQIARTLAEQLPQAKVTLAVPSPVDLPLGELPFQVQQYSARSLVPLAWKHTTMVSFTLPASLLPFTTRTNVVLDLYGTLLAELMEIANIAIPAPHRSAWANLQRERLNIQLTWADFILYANDRQRRLYLGMLGALGRLTPEAYASDKSFSRLLGSAPFGVRPGEPEPRSRPLKGGWPGIRPTDKVLIWNGVVSEWYDVPTLIYAIHQLTRERDDVKLFFLGTEVPDIKETPKLQSLGAGSVISAIMLCRQLGLLDKHVFFNVDWVSYEETVDYLMDADIGVCTYFAGLETEYSMRTRLLDLFWTERPVVCTRGDALADLVDERRLGITVPPGDIQALVQAISRVLDDRAFIEECKANLRAAKAELRWERTLAPLIEFCRMPRLAGPSKRARLLPLATRLARLTTATAQQLITARNLGPGYF